jgi:hypothetical protein
VRVKADPSAAERRLKDGKNTLIILRDFPSDMAATHCTLGDIRTELDQRVETVAEHEKTWRSLMRSSRTIRMWPSFSALA